MHTTRLHRQIVNRVGLIVIVLAFLVTASCISVMNWLYHKSDAEQVAAGLGKVELLLHNEQDELSRAVRDYAVWNDAYEYMSRPNLKFETDNFTQQSLNVMQLDFVAMMTAPDKVLFSSEINAVIPDPKTTPATPDCLKNSISLSICWISASEYTKLPPRGRTIAITGIWRFWMQATVSSSDGVNPSAARSEQSSMRCAPFFCAVRASSSVSTQASKIREDVFVAI